MVDKKAVRFSDWKFLAGVAAVSIVMLAVLVAAGATSVWQTWGDLNLTEIYFNVNTTSTLGDFKNGTDNYNTTLTAVLFNITINRTVGEGATVALNISEVNIILPSNWSFVADSQQANSSIAGSVLPNGTFQNTTANGTTGQMLQWIDTLLYVANDDNDTANIFNFRAITNIPGVYNITVVTINGSGADNTTFYKNLTVGIFDIIAPHVNWTGLTPTNNSNLSYYGIEANLSWSDAGTIDTINITLFNATSGLALKSTLFQPGDKGHFNDTLFNFTIGASTIPEGLYDLNVSVMNDTYDNENISAQLTRRIIIDRTAPTATFSCSPTVDVNVGEVVTCTCTGQNDTATFSVAETSGLASTTFNSTGKSSVAESVTESCTVVDRAGNSRTYSTTYTVYSSDAAPGTGGGGSWSGTKTVRVSDEEFTAGKQTSLKANERAKVKVSGSYHFVAVDTVSETTAKITVSSTPQEATMSVGDERKFDVTDDGYYDLSVTLNAIVSGKADLTILSISEEVTAETEAAQVGVEEAASGVAEEEAEEEEISKSWIWIVIVVIIVLVVIGGGYGLKKRKK